MHVAVLFSVHFRPATGYVDTAIDKINGPDLEVGGFRLQVGNVIH